MRSLPCSSLLLSLSLLIGCSNMPWVEEEEQPSQPGPTTITVPPEDREQVEALLRQRAEAQQRREAALTELSRARTSLSQWQESADPKKEEMVRAWQVIINELEEEVRRQNVALGRDQDDGLIPQPPPAAPPPALQESQVPPQ